MHILKTYKFDKDCMLTNPLEYNLLVHSKLLVKHQQFLTMKESKHSKQ